MTTRETIPLILPIDLAGAILNLSRGAAYAMAKRGDLPLLPGGGRRKVPTARLEQLIGRRLEIADIAAAEQRIARERTKLSEYGKAYRTARATLEAKKATRSAA